MFLKRVLLAGAVLFAATWASEACVHKPRGYDAVFEEVAQQAIIVHHNGYENLILRVQYEFKDPNQKRPSELAWVIPVPNAPVSYKVADPAVFKDATRIVFPRTKMRNGRMLKSAGRSRREPQLQFLEKVTVGDYKIQPIKAVGLEAGQALNVWLGKNGFSQVPVKNMSWYVDQSWTFLAVKMKAPKGQKALAVKGAFDPLQIRFKSQNIVYPLKFSSHQGTFDLSLFVITSRSLPEEDLFWELGRFGVQAFPKPKTFSLSGIQSSRSALHKLLTTLAPDEIISDELHMTKLIGRSINSDKNKVENWDRDFAIRLPLKGRKRSKLEKVKSLLRTHVRSKLGRGQNNRSTIHRRLMALDLQGKDKEALTYFLKEMIRGRKDLDHPYYRLSFGVALRDCRGMDLEQLRLVMNLIPKERLVGRARGMDIHCNSIFRAQGEIAKQLCMEMVKTEHLGWRTFAIQYMARLQYSMSDRKLDSLKAKFFLLALKDKDSQNRVYALQGIPPGPIPGELKAAVKALLKDPESKVRDAAERVWARYGGVDDVWTSLVRKLESGDRVQRLMAIRSMGQLPRTSVKAVPHLLKALKNDKDPEVRKSAAFNLGLFHNGADQSVPVLTKMLKDPAHKDIRSGLLFGLSFLGPKAKSAFPWIKAYFHDSDPMVRQAARSSLLYAGKGAADHLDVLMDLYKSGGVDIKRHIAGILSICGEKSVPHLVALLGASNLEDRILGARAIARSKLPRKEYIPGLLKLAEVKRRTKLFDGLEARALAVNALGYMKEEAKEALPLLRRYAVWNKDNGMLSLQGSAAIWRITGETKALSAVVTEALSLKNLESQDAATLKEQRLTARTCLVYLTKLGEAMKEKELELLFLLKVDSQSWCHKELIETLGAVSVGTPETITHLKSLKGDKDLGESAKEALAAIEKRRSGK